MSGIQHFTPRALPPTSMGHDWRTFGNPPPNNYFKTREINLNDCAYDDSYYDYQDYYDTGYNDEIHNNYHDTTYNYDDRVQFCDTNTNAELSNEPRAMPVRQIKIEINLQTVKGQLPFIQIAEPPLKLLLDAALTNRLLVRNA